MKSLLKQLFWELRRYLGFEQSKGIICETKLSIIEIVLIDDIIPTFASVQWHEIQRGTSLTPLDSTLGI